MKIRSPRLLVVLLSVCVVHAASQNLFPEGNLEMLNLDGQLESWSLPHEAYLKKIQGTATLETEGSNHFMRLTLENPEFACHFAADIPLPDGAANVAISYRVRCAEIVPASDPSWSGVFNGGCFLDENDKIMGLFSGPKRHKQSTDGWVEVEDVFQVPVGAKKVRLQPGLYHTEGTADFDDFKVTIE